MVGLEKEAHGHVSRRRRNEDPRYSRRERRSISPQPDGRYPRRRTQAGHARKVSRLWRLAERPRGRAAGGIRRRRGLLDRREEWRLDHVHLLPQRITEV